MTQPNQWSGQQGNYNAYQQAGNWNTGQNNAGNWPATAGNVWAGQSPVSNQNPGNWNQAWGNNSNQINPAGAVTTGVDANVTNQISSDTTATTTDKIDPELAEFDSQFKTWEGQFGKWKDENKDHPDKSALAKYEEQWTKWRDDLLARRKEIIAGKKDPTATSTESNETTIQSNQPPVANNASQMWGPYGGQTVQTQGQMGMASNQNWVQGQNWNQPPNQMNAWGQTQNNSNAFNWASNVPGQNSYAQQGFNPNAGQNINPQAQTWGPPQNQDAQGPNQLNSNWASSGTNPGQNLGGPSPGQNFNASQNQGQNFGGLNQGQSGPNQGQFGPSFGTKQGSNFVPNQVPNFTGNQGQNLGPNQGQNFGSNQGQNFGPNQGQNFGQNQGQNFGPNQGQNLGSNQGSNFGQNQGPNFGQNQGHNYDQNQGSNQGQNQGQNFGQNQGQNFGSNQPPNSGPNQPPNIGPNQPPNMGSNPPPNIGSNPPPNIGSNQPPNTGSDQLPNFRLTQPPNFAPNQPLNDNFGETNQGSNYSESNQRSNFGGSNQGRNVDDGEGMKSDNDGVSNQGSNIGINHNSNFGSNQGSNCDQDQGKNNRFGLNQGDRHEGEMDTSRNGQSDRSCEQNDGHETNEDTNWGSNKNWNFDQSKTNSSMNKLDSTHSSGNNWNQNEPNWKQNRPPFGSNSGAAKRGSSMEQNRLSPNQGSGQGDGNHSNGPNDEGGQFSEKHSQRQDQDPGSQSSNLNNEMGTEGTNAGIGAPRGHAPGMGTRGPPPNMGMRGPPPNMGMRGPPPSMGMRGPPPSMGMRGPPPNMGSRGPPPGMGSRGPPPGMGSRGPPPGMGARGPNQGMGARGPNQGMGSRGPNEGMGARGGSSQGMRPRGQNPGFGMRNSGPRQGSEYSGNDNHHWNKSNNWNYDEDTHRRSNSPNKLLDLKFNSQEEHDFERMSKNSSPTNQPNTNKNWNADRGTFKKSSRFDNNYQSADSVESDTSINMSWTAVKSKQNWNEPPKELKADPTPTPPATVKSTKEIKVNEDKKENGIAGISHHAQGRATGNILALFKQRAQESNQAAEAEATSSSSKTSASDASKTGSTIPGLDIVSTSDTTKDPSASTEVKKSPLKVTPKVEKEPTKSEIKFGDADRLNIGPIGVDKKANWKPSGDWYDDEDNDHSLSDATKIGPDIDSFGKKKRSYQHDITIQPRPKIARQAGPNEGNTKENPNNRENPNSKVSTFHNQRQRGGRGGPPGRSHMGQRSYGGGGGGGPRQPFSGGPRFGGGPPRRGGRGRGRGPSFFEGGPFERGSPQDQHYSNDPFFELGASDIEHSQKPLVKVVDYGHRGLESPKMVPPPEGTLKMATYQRSDNKPQANLDAADQKQSKVSIEDLLEIPGRFMRPPKLIIVLRGLPGAGKTTISKMIKEKEISNGGSAPRIICLDDYFMVESEKLVVDEETGRKIKKKIMEYEYEPEYEENYRKALIKSFKKQVDEKFYPFIIIDCVNKLTENYEEIVNYCHKKDFEFYIGEIEVEVQTCYQRNTRNRSLIDLQQMALQWEKTPNEYTIVDLTSMIQDANIQEVNMEDCEKIEDDVPDIQEINSSKQDSDPEEDIEASTFKVINELMKSKWDTDQSQEEKLDKLDGVRLAKKKKADDEPQTIDDWLQLSEQFKGGKAKPGKKTVRWADIEERREQVSARNRGFVLGQTNWERMTDPSLGSNALVQVRYIEPREKKK